MQMIGIITIAVLAGGCNAGDIPEMLCDRVAEIKVLPFREKGSDEVYNGLMSAGDAAVPCLIAKITDTTQMPDPRMAPTYDHVVVGDVAFFILVRITGNEFDAFFPAEVKGRYKQKGVYAYFEYVADPSHRVEFQQRWREWWADRAAQTSSDPDGAR